MRIQRLCVWRDWRLATKLAILLVVLAIAPLAVVTLIHGIVTRAELLDAVRVQNLQRARGTAQVIDNYLAERLADVHLLGIVPQSARLAQSPQDQEQRTLMRLRLRQTRELYDYEALYLTDSSGTVLVASDDRFERRNYIAARWFLNAIAGQVSIDEPRYDSDDGQVYLHVSAPIRNPAGAIEGTAIGRITMDAIDRIIATDTNFSGRGDFGVLWDDLGIRLAHGTRPDLRFKPLVPFSSDVAGALIVEARYGPATSDWLTDASRIPELVERSRLLLYDRDAEPHLYFTSIADGPVYAAVVPLQNKRWLYGVWTPEANIFSALGEQTKRALLVALCVGLLAVLITPIVARWATRPIRRVAETANAIAAGDMTRRVRLKQRDETGKLAAAFDAMADALAEKDAQLRSYAENLERMVQERTAALSKGEAQLRCIVEGTDALLVNVDKRGKFTHVNDAAARTMEHSPEAMIGKKYLNFVHPEDRRRVHRAFIEQVVARREFSTNEFRVVTASGQVKWVHFAANLIIEKGQVVGQTGVALDVTERKQAEEEIRRLATKLKAIARPTRRMSALMDVDQLAQQVVESLHEITGCYNANLFLLKDEQLVLAAGRGGYANGEPPLGYHLPLGQGIIGCAAQAGAPVLVNDVTQDSRYWAWAGLPRTRSELAVPIKSGVAVLGVLDMQATEPNAFDAADLEALGVLADQLAVVLDNARLFEETRRRAEQLALLYDAGLTVNRELDPRVQLETLLKIAMKALRADRAEFFRYDAALQELAFALGSGYNAEGLAEMRAVCFRADEERGLVGWVARQRLPLHVPDVSADPRWVVIDPAIRSALMVPAEHEDELRGILSVFSTRTDAFTPQDERLLVLFANQIAVAMENTRLFAELQSALTMTTRLYQMSAQLLTVTTMEETERLAAQTLHDAFAADVSNIVLFDAQGSVMSRHGIGLSSTFYQEAH